MTLADTIWSRWTYGDAPHFEPLKRAIGFSLDVNDAIRAEHTRLAGDAKLTGLGRQDALRKFIGTTVAPRLRHARATIDATRTQIEAARAKLKPPAPDKTDSAGAVLRSEMRQMLRTSKPGVQIKMLTDPKADPMLLMAVIESPLLAGIQDEAIQHNGANVSLVDMLTATYVERTFPKEVAAIAKAEDAVAVLDAATRVALNTVQVAADFDNDRILGDFLTGALGPDKTAVLDSEAARLVEHVAEPG